MPSLFEIKTLFFFIWNSWTPFSKRGAAMYAVGEASGGARGADEAANQDSQRTGDVCRSGRLPITDTHTTLHHIKPIHHTPHHTTNWPVIPHNTTTHPFVRHHTPTYPIQYHTPTRPPISHYTTTHLLIPHYTPTYPTIATITTPHYAH